jgi:hypothetical protein
MTKGGADSEGKRVVFVPKMQADRQGGYGRSVVEALLAEVRRLQELSTSEL